MSQNETFNSIDADQWFLRNMQEDGKKDPYQVSNLLAKWLGPFSPEINDLLEIGCGSGHALMNLSRLLNSNGFGVDPSNKAVS